MLGSSASSWQNAVSGVCRHHPQTRAAVPSISCLLTSSIFEYPGNKVTNTWQEDKVEIEENLTKKIIDNKKLGILEEGLVEMGIKPS